MTLSYKAGVTGSASPKAAEKNSGVQEAAALTKLRITKPCRGRAAGGYWGSAKPKQQGTE